MKLEEKFGELEILGICIEDDIYVWDSNLFNKNVNYCVETTEDFAIGFYDYCEIIRGRIVDNEITIEEAMEIYKKEK